MSSRLRIAAAVLAPGLALGVMIAACSGGSDGDGGEPDAGVGTTTTTTLPEAGTGVLTLGSDRLEFTVEACSEDPAPDDVPEAHRVFLLVGNGTVDGSAFEVIVTRYEASGVGVVPTTTETIQLTTGSGAEARGIEAERSAVGGGWLDLRESDPAGALLDIEAGFVRAEGTFGPDASGVGSPDLLAGTFIALCPVR